MIPALLIFGGVVGVALLFWFGLAAAGAAPVFSMSKATLVPLQEQESQMILRMAFRGKVNIDSDWLREQGFHPVGTFAVTRVMMEPRMVVWQKAEKATWLCLYLVHGNVVSTEYVTRMDHGHLSTAAGKDAQLFPTEEGSFVQSFTVADIETLWDRHAEAIDYLRESRHLRPQRSDLSLKDDFEGTLRRQAAFIRSIPLWLVKVPYWYFIRRSSRHGQSISRLYARSP